MKNQFDVAKAIEFCDSAFVFVDNNFIVQYLNYNAFTLFRNNEHAFKSVDPDFCFYNVHCNVLSSVVTLLKQHNLFENIEMLQIGDNVTFYHELENVMLKIKFTPIFEGNHQHIGSCIELVDVTSLFEVKKQFDNAIKAGIRGNFAHKIDFLSLASVHPLFFDVCSQINDLFFVLDNFVTDLSVSLEHLSHGDLTHCGMELALIPEIRQEQLHCAECKLFDKCLNKNYINPQESFSLEEDNYLHTIKRDLHYTLQNLWSFVKKIQHNQSTLDNSIRSITESYSEIAMSTEIEYIKATEIQELVAERINALINIHSEINQATQIRDISKQNQEIIQTLKTTLHNTGEQILYISHIAQTLDNIFVHHTEGLQSGLKEIKHGNLGKGIAIINEQSIEIITKSRDAMSQIREAIIQMNSSFHSSNSSIDEIVNTVVYKMNDMDEQIQIFSLLMSSIQGAVQSQEKTTFEMRNFTEDVQNLLTNTVGQIERMIYSTSDLVQTHLNLKTASKVFKIDRNYSIEVLNHTDESYAINLENIQLWK